VAPSGRIHTATTLRVPAPDHSPTPAKSVMRRRAPRRSWTAAARALWSFAFPTRAGGPPPTRRSSPLSRPNSNAPSRRQRPCQRTRSRSIRSCANNSAHSDTSNSLQRAILSPLAGVV